MWIDRLTYSSTTNALSLAAQFAEQRHKVLAENLANIDTPDYHTQRLDPEAFQASLQAALDQQRETRRSGLELRDNRQFSTVRNGGLDVRPAEEPAPNVLFHDGTNARLETALADVAENQMYYEFATTLLRGRYQSMLKAIKGRNE